MGTEEKPENDRSSGRQAETGLHEDDHGSPQEGRAAALKRYRKLYDFAPIPYLTIGSDECIVAINFKAADLLFGTPSQLSGTEISRFVLPEDHGRFRDCLKRAEQGDSGASAEIRLVVGEPAQRICTEMRVNSTEQPGEQGSDGFRLSLTDISELKRVEGELRQDRAKLERSIDQRTAELRNTNETLRKEIQAREDIEQKLRRNQIRLRALAAELTRTEERQRSELARDLHDLVAQTLAVANMKLSSMKKRMTDQRAVTTLQETEQLVRQMIEATRGILTELSPPVIEEQDVPTALEWLVDHIREKHELEARLDEVDLSVELSEEKKRFLFRSVRELLMNVVRHAQASSAWVALTTANHGLNRGDVTEGDGGGRVVVTVRDDGRGFNVADARRSSGFGIFSIQQRVEDLGGSFMLDSAVGKGTKSVLTLPRGD